jgi:small subunit ribosomal protein S4
MNKLGQKKTKFKIQRALGVELPGLGKPGALAKRNYPPGQHGQKRQKRPSTYGLQLREKQKLMFHYGLRDEQLRRCIREAKKWGSAWMDSLVGLLERRADNVVFRLGFARSVAAARQLVSHGHVFVNGKRETIGSRVLPVGTTITLTERPREFPAVTSSLLDPRLPLPSFLEKTAEIPEGTVISNPTAEHVPFEFDGSLVVGFYARSGL